MRITVFLSVVAVIAVALSFFNPLNINGTVIKKRTSFDDCKIISEVGYNTVYSCPEGIIYVVKKK